MKNKTSHTNYTGPFSAFTINIFFLVLIIVGVFLLPFITVKLEPSKTYNSIAVSFAWHNTSAEIIEQNVTSKLEAAMATVKGIRDINSVSGNGYGQINASFGDKVNIEEIRYEIATIIRGIYPSFPDGVSYPWVSANRPSGNQVKGILSYYVNAGTETSNIGTYLEKSITPRLANIPGVYQVNISGVEPYRYVVKYDETKLSALHISPYEISDAINDFFSRSEVGLVHELSKDTSAPYIFVTLKVRHSDSLSWRNIPVKKVDDRIFYLTDIATVSYTTEEAMSYFRINGNSTVTLEILADAKANYINLAGIIKNEMDQAALQLPPGYQLTLAYDASVFLKDELIKISWRSVATVSILLLFVFLVSRKWKYLLLIVISLAANLVIAVLFYYVLHIEINLYSLAGITVSMGMIIDGSIVMIDHLRNTGNRKVFLALTGAHLTTIGAVCIIFFMDQQQRIFLEDFAWVMIINLLVSLPIALFFVPALMEKMPLEKRKGVVIFRKNRRVLIANKIYLVTIDFLSRWKKLLIPALILLFGLPLFLMPVNYRDPANKWQRAYNAIFDNSFYQKIRPYADKALGGTLRLFAQKPNAFRNNMMQTRTAINVEISLPKGTSLEQMNDIVVKFETYLRKFSQIEQFDCHVGREWASMNISFLKKYENGAFPHMLKRELEQKAIYTGLADFTITGVGQGFDNTIYPENANYAIVLQGYNYDRLLVLADSVSQVLKTSPRVEKVYLKNSRMSWSGEKSDYEYVFKIFDKDWLIAKAGNSYVFYQSLYSLAGQKQMPGSVTVNDVPYSYSVQPSEGTGNDVWRVMNYPVTVGNSGSFLRLNQFAKMDKEHTGSEISRYNQQYQVIVNYNFIGTFDLGHMIRERTVKQVQEKLPLGYSIRSYDDSWGFWGEDKWKMIWPVFLTIGIIFLLCCILLNSLSQSFMVIAMIPISFIGVFITCQVVDFNFDEGGYASFIVLSGIVVNWALFILNDYNNLYKTKRFKNNTRKTYMKAFNQKIIPVVLSAASCILGLIPFVINGKDDVFWYALAVSTIGGLLFSVLATLLFMPLFMRHWKRVVSNKAVEM